MTDRQDGEKGRSRLVRVLVRVLALSTMVVAGLYLLLTVVLNSPLATNYVSRLVSGMLQQSARVAGVRLAGGSLVVHGLTIANPAGFAGGNMLTARSIMVTPAWRELLAGRKSFTAIEIRELDLSLAKNSAGAWNFAGLKRLATGKKSAGETFVRRLVLERSAVTVNGRGITDLSLAVNDLASKGSAKAGILLACKDEYGAVYRLEGYARPGAQPALELALSAPSIPFKVLRAFKLPVDPAKGTGSVHLTAGLHGDELQLGGTAAFDRLTVQVKGEELPLAGALDFAGRYDLKGDTATLDRCFLRVGGALRLQAKGRMERVKSERLFTAEISYSGGEVNELFALLPPGLRRDLLPGGTLLPGVVRLAGDGADGITAGSAAVALRHGELKKGGRLLVDGVAVDASLVKVAAGWELRGRLSQKGVVAGTSLQLSGTPFTALLSAQLHPLQAELPAITARVAGIPIKGSMQYRPAEPAPVTVRLEMPTIPLAELARAFPGKPAEFSQGTAAVSIQAAGRGFGDFRGDVTARLADLRGKYGGKKIALAEASSRATVSCSGGKPAATGRLKVSGGLVDGKLLAASFAYRVADGLFTLSDGDCTVQDTNVSFAEIRGPLPRRPSAAEGGGFPLALRFNGIRSVRDGTGVDGLSGSLSAQLMSDAGERWLEGTGAVTVLHLAYGSRDVGSLAASFVLARGKATVDVTGKVLDGRLTASASGDPFAAQRGAAFTVKLAGAVGNKAAEMLGNSLPVRVSGGVLDAAGTGDYRPKGGLRCRLAVTGTDLALAGTDGRALLAGGGLRLDGEWADGSLRLKEGKVNVGSGLELVGRGELTHAAAAARAGEISVRLAKVPLASVRSAAVNFLPRPFRAATAAGAMEAAGTVRVKGEHVLVEGEMTLEDGALELPSQKLSIAAIDGAIPFSLDFPGTAAAKLPERPELSRKNYPTLLQTMQRGVKNGRTLTIGKVRFGTTELGPTTLSLRAGNGLTEISSLQAGFYQGVLCGRGFFRYRRGAQYGADILIHDVSLREICNAYPAVKGYLSGRLDGMMSLYGEGKSLNDLSGIVEIWTRSVKGEKMLVSKEFLQKLAGKKLKGIFFREDRSYDRGEIEVFLENGYLTFETLDISHTNFLGIRDLSVSVAAVQNRIGLDHLFTAIREAAARGKAAEGGAAPGAAPPETEFKWEE
jgi:hypothetical protein